MRKTTYLILIFIIFTSCKKAPETKFNKNGISLTCPEEWVITDTEISDDYNYLAIEKEGFNSSGLITVIWVNNYIDLEECLNSYKNELKNSKIYKKSIVFGEQYESKYNGINTISTTYNVSIIGIKFNGIIHTFNHKNKTLCICKQEAIEDINDNKEGFDIIEKSLNIK